LSGARQVEVVAGEEEGMRELESFTCEGGGMWFSLYPTKFYSNPRHPTAEIHQGGETLIP
jgi:hypothetical protein